MSVVSKVLAINNSHIKTSRFDNKILGLYMYYYSRNTRYIVELIALENNLTTNRIYQRINKLYRSI